MRRADREALGGEGRAGEVQHPRAVGGPYLEHGRLGRRLGADHDGRGEALAEGTTQPLRRDRASAAAIASNRWRSTARRGRHHQCHADEPRRPSSQARPPTDARSVANSAATSARRPTIEAITVALGAPSSRQLDVDARGALAHGLRRTQTSAPT